MEELDFREFLTILWRKKIEVISIVICFIIFGLIYSYKLEVPEYKSSTTLILGRINSSNYDISTEKQDLNQITQSEISINANLISTYSELIKSKSLMNKVKENLNINIDENDFKKDILVSRISETELMEITVTNEDAELAANIANEIAKVFSSKIEEIYNISNVYIIDKAIPAEAPFNVNHMTDIIISVMLGIIFSIGYAILLYLLDNTIKTENDIEKNIGLKTLITIPVRKKQKNELVKQDLIIYEDSKSIISEAFRTLRTNVQFSNINNKENKVMLITSCFSSEGKSYISANLATVFAQAGKKVVLIDADMRRGRQAKIFKTPNELGLSNYLSNLDNNGMEINERINKYICETEIKNLNIITSGNIPPNPSELLTSNKLPELIKELSIFYDLIIFDGAPVLPITDSLILARMANSTILVSLYNKTKIEELLKAKKDIQNVGGRIIGAVLNKVPVNNREYENKYYYSPKEEKIKVKKETKVVKGKFKKYIDIIKEKIEKISKNRLKKKIKLLTKGTESNENLEKNEKTVLEYEEELKKIENEIKLQKEEELVKKKKAKEKYEEENQKKREELVKIKEAEIARKKESEIEAKNRKEEIEEKNKEKEQRRTERKQKIEEKLSKLKEKLNIARENFKKEYLDLKEKISEEFKNIQEKNKIESERKRKIREENKIKNAEIREEKNKIKNEEKAKRKAEEEIIKNRKEKERLKLSKIKEEERRKREAELENQRQIKLEEKMERKIKKSQIKEERKKYKEEEKERKKEEARIKEQILEDNLYPKTKYNKDL